MGVGQAYNRGMTRAAVDALLYLLDESFSGNEEHSLMANLRSVRTEDWLWKPHEGHRSIRRIAIRWS